MPLFSPHLDFTDFDDSDQMPLFGPYLDFTDFDDSDQSGEGTTHHNHNHLPQTKPTNDGEAEDEVAECLLGLSSHTKSQHQHNTAQQSMAALAGLKDQPNLHLATKEQLMAELEKREPPPSKQLWNNIPLSDVSPTGNVSTPNLDNDDFMYGTTDYDEDGIIAKSSATASSSSKADDKKSSNSNITSNSLNNETMACGVVVPVVLTPVKKRDIFRNKIMEKDSIPNARDITIIGHQGQDNDSTYKARNKKWMERFCQLEAHKKTHGNVDVKQQYTPNKHLGRWVNTQRTLMNNGQCMEWRCKMLKDIGLESSIGKGKHGKRKDSLSISKGRTKQWAKKFAALKDYKENHGHCDVPTSTPLGNWVSRQRNEYRGFCAKKGDEPHPDEFCRRFEQLKGIGFKFVIRVRKPCVKCK